MNKWGRLQRCFVAWRRETKKSGQTDQVPEGSLSASSRSGNPVRGSSWGSHSYGGANALCTQRLRHALNLVLSFMNVHWGEVDLVVLRRQVVQFIQRSGFGCVDTSEIADLVELHTEVLLCSSIVEKPYRVVRSRSDQYISSQTVQREQAELGWDTYDALLRERVGNGVRRRCGVEAPRRIVLDSNATHQIRLGSVV